MIVEYNFAIVNSKCIGLSTIRYFSAFSCIYLILDCNKIEVSLPEL